MKMSASGSRSRFRIRPSRMRRGVSRGSMEPSPGAFQLATSTPWGPKKVCIRFAFDLFTILSVVRLVDSVYFNFWIV